MTHPLYYALARSAQATGRKIEAIQNCERALESSPGFAPARELLDELRK